MDFRYINAVSQFDPYPMPRIDDLMERVERAKYITTLDIGRLCWHQKLGN